jgi:hypothetical protein
MPQEEALASRYLRREFVTTDTDGRRIIRGNYGVLGAGSPRDCLIFTPPPRFSLPRFWRFSAVARAEEAGPRPTDPRCRQGRGPLATRGDGPDYQADLADSALTSRNPSRQQLDVVVGRDPQPWRQKRRHAGCFRVPWLYHDLRESAHITLLELTTVRMSLEEFGSFVGLRRGEVVRLWTDM